MLVHQVSDQQMPQVLGSPIKPMCGKNPSVLLPQVLLDWALVPKILGAQAQHRPQPLVEEVLGAQAQYRLQPPVERVLGDQNFVDRALDNLPQTPWEYLSADQQLKLMKTMAKTSRDLRTKLSNAQRSKKSTQGRITEHQQIMMLLATNDIPGLRRILTVQARRGRSPRALCSILQRAVDGKYRARGGFNERDMDIAFLVKAIGGPRLLYALQKSHGLASGTTVRKHSKIPKLVASIGIPTQKDISDNISSFLSPEIKTPPVPARRGIPGNVLMFDGIALETKCCYCPVRNAILGLCREHSNRVNTSVDSLDSVDEVRVALQREKHNPKKVCFGSDATVVAIAPYAQDDHYTPVPIVVSPSDQTEKGPELAEWMQVVLDTWEHHPQGKALHGRIEALASDGASSYRLAKHLICMTTKTDPNSPLGKIICPLLGMNCFTSKDQQLSTCDPKHIFKRRTEIFGLSKSYGTLLRNNNGIMIGDTNILPSDTIQHLTALPEVTIQTAQQLLDPADKQNVPKAVSLVQQLDKIKDLELPFHPSKIQMRKSVVFFSKVLGYFVFPFITIEMSLSQQVTSLSTYAFLAAALEMRHGSFCFTGPLYSDSQATIKNIVFTIAKLQILDGKLKLYIILEGTDRLEGVFADCRTQDHARNFDIEQLVQKLAIGALINAAFQRNPDLDRDHRRLKLSGALGIDHVNPKSWEGDACVGNVDLQKAWAEGDIEANKLLVKHFGPSGRPECDLLRPLGKVYVGLDPKHEDKRSEEENEVEYLPAVNVAPKDIDDSPRSAVLSSEEVQAVQENVGDQDHNDMPLGMDLDQFFPDDSDGDEVPVAFLKFVEAEGKRYLKSSLVATLSSNRSKKATMRTLRVRGVALEDLHSRKAKEFDPGDLDEDNLLKSGDLVAPLLHASGKICLGLFIVKTIRTGAEKSTLTAVSLPDLENPQKKVVVTGQLVGMKKPEIEGQPADFWEWTGKYLCLNTDIKDERETRKLFVTEIPGVLVHSVAPSVSQSTVSGPLNPQPTWSVPSEQLEEILKDAWDLLDPESRDISARQPIEVVNSNSLPYRDALVRKLSEMRHHVARHILMSSRGVDEVNLLKYVGSEPCGFCGLDDCFTQVFNLGHPGKAASIKSTCPYHYSGMNYKKAIPRTIWKYNAMYHVIAEHLTANNAIPVLPPEFIGAFFVRRSEEEALGIDAAETAQWRRQHQVPDSDAFDQMFPLSNTPVPVSEKDAPRLARDAVDGSDAGGDRRGYPLGGTDSGQDEADVGSAVVTLSTHTARSRVVNGEGDGGDGGERGK
ncbi:hypothetical protein DFH08DRAFT_820317 [Mycena albidolilacea]|uniref:Uncharacterized protein n=1 Tax=Mycena albidolilacea TaxID=1033008 RepID=A0AAD7EEB3_9AGAR|nr:hypothetical protein DFH08DRAFT_820317 [Mycena albidolilacea]